MAAVHSHQARLAQRSRRDHVAGTAWVRSSAVAGAVFFTLIAVQSTLRSGAPSATDPGQEIVDFVNEHQGRLQLGAVLLGLAMAAALAWLPALYRTLSRAEGASSGLAIAAIAGGALAAASGAVTALIQGTIAVQIGNLDADGVGMWWTMWLLSIGAIVLGLLVCIGVTAAISLRHHVFARWFAVASVFLALLSVVGVFTLGYAGAGVQTVAGVAVLLDSVWILLVSVFLWLDPSLAAR
jgi:hypothetical protein